MSNSDASNAVEATTMTRRESLHPDIVTFCTLLARIMYRCLMEHNVQIITWVTTPVVEVSCVAQMRKGFSMGKSHNADMPLVVAGYVRRSSRMQADNFSIDAQKRAISEECARRGFPAPVFYEDDERSARGEQIIKRPAFKRLLEDAEAGRVQVIISHTLDRWSRNVMVTLQSFRILAEQRTSFVSLSEHIDYSTPEGKLQLTILAAFAAYFSDMLAKHTSKGKGERAAQGLYNGDIPFGYRSTGAKNHLEFDPATHPGLRMIGELRLQGFEAERIADKVNEAGYRTGSKRFGQRLFTKDTITAILRNEFFAAYAPDDDRGTVLYHGQQFWAASGDIYL